MGTRQYIPFSIAFKDSFTNYTIDDSLINEIVNRLTFLEDELGGEIRHILSSTIRN